MTDPTLYAGAAAADITPTDLSNALLAGFGLERRAVGVLEPLEAGALYLRQGDVEVALVTLDLVGFLRPWVERLRARTGFADPRNVVCCATHTHSAPDMLGMWGRAWLRVIPRSSGIDPAYMELVTERAADAVRQARASARPARVRPASFEVPERWTRNDRQGARFDTATTLAVESADGVGGERIATVLNFASHPETLWSRNKQVSPDFPGAFRRRSRTLAGGVPLYFSGPLGAMLTPNVPVEASTDERRAYAETLGTTLAELTETALAAATPTGTDAPALAHTQRELSLASDNWRMRLAFRLGFLDPDVRKNRVHSEMHHVCLGGLEILTTPGEAVPEVGHQFRDRMHAAHRMLLCLCTDEIGYVLSPEMFDDERYKYEVTMSLGPDTAPALLNAATSLLSS